MAKVKESRSTQKKTIPRKVIDPKSTKKVKSAFKGHRIGYVRVSTVDQNAARQLEGIDVERTFTDKASGKDVKRPQLEAMLAFVREGDTVICHSMDRMARNLDDLRRIVLGLTQRGVHVQFIKESLTFTGEDSPMANLLLSVMGAFAQFERELIKERQREGIAIAKKAGAYKGRKRSLTLAKADELRRRVALGEKRTAIARELGISRFTTYEYAPAIPEEQVPAAKRKKTILCVDPDDQVLSVRKFMLEMRGYAVKTAQSDEQAIDLLKQGSINLVLSRLPGIIREVKAKGHLVPTLFIAGYSELSEANADAVLMQSTQSPVEVLAAVKTLLNQFKLKRQESATGDRASILTNGSD